MSIRLLCGVATVLLVACGHGDVRVAESCTVVGDLVTAFTVIPMKLRNGTEKRTVFSLHCAGGACSGTTLSLDSLERRGSLDAGDIVALSIQPKSIVGSRAVIAWGPSITLTVDAGAKEFALESPDAEARGKGSCGQ